MHSRAATWVSALCASAALFVLPVVGRGQAAPSEQPGQSPPGVIPGVKMGGSGNIRLLGHVPLGGYFRVMDDELEQDPNRPYAYVSQARDRPGFTVIDLHDLNNIQVLYNWRIENPELHKGLGGMDGKYFKSHGRYYYVQSLQFDHGTPDATLGAVIADVTGLPDTSKVKVVARIRDDSAPGGFHNLFAYKHSDGRNLLITTIKCGARQRLRSGQGRGWRRPGTWKIAEFRSLRAASSCASAGSGITTSTWGTTPPRTRTSSTARAAAGTTCTTSPTSRSPSC